MIRLKIGFKNGTILTIDVDEFNVGRNPVTGNKSYGWKQPEGGPELVTFDADEVLWITREEKS